ncbi:hypothetical protein [Natrialba aegyptia]|uniref:Uncharacterized protein n=1 Tax=Natrialba aegyptia DSM 13077 TaxID=1227491 RepID=M0B3C7_9EURY|nr:hypothetical protein [Natrialba aegyptia]ELZ05305.1 hypothetical protein C480_10495 [Natrialba aegyptia DSM 13077]
MNSERHEKEIEHGERFAYSRLTDTWYRVTAWTDLGEGRIQSHSKEAVDREEVPEEWTEGVEEVA